MGKKLNVNLFRFDAYEAFALSKTDFSIVVGIEQNHFQVCSISGCAHVDPEGQEFVSCDLIYKSNEDGFANLKEMQKALTVTKL